MRFVMRGAMNYLLLYIAIAVLFTFSPIQASGQSSKQAGDTNAVIETSEVVVEADAIQTNSSEHRLDAATLMHTVDVGAALSQFPGVATRSLAGPGSLTQLSIRGAPPAHTEVSVDGVMVSKLASAQADLSVYPIFTSDDIRIDKGISNNSSGIVGAAGGSVALALHPGPSTDGYEWTAGLGAGSYGFQRYHFRHGKSLASGDTKMAYVVRGGFASAENDFRYFNDNGTALNSSDDSTSHRVNNDFAVGAIAARGKLQADSLRIDAGFRLTNKQQGVPTLGHRQDASARLDSLQTQITANMKHARPLLGGFWRSSVYGVSSKQRYIDSKNDIGLTPEDRRYDLRSIGGDVSSTWVIKNHSITPTLRMRRDSFSDQDLLSGLGTTLRGDRTAYSASVAGSLSFASDRITVWPTLRLDSLATQPVVDPRLGSLPPPRRTEAEMSGAVSSRFIVASGFAVLSQVGWYYRPPTIYELYGDRGFSLGNPELLSERGPTGDLGVQYKRNTAAGALEAGVTAFFSNPRDQITYALSSGLTTRPINLGDVFTKGLEVSTRAAWKKKIYVTANYTYLDAKQANTTTSNTGKDLPIRPRHQGYFRAEVIGHLFHRQWRTHTDVRYASRNFLDAANFHEVPQRLLFGIGTNFFVTKKMSLDFSMSNLLDRRTETIATPSPNGPVRYQRAISDFYGYPLPGRAAYVQIAFRQ